MIVNKVTTGFVTQQYDTEKKKFVGQSFTAIDDVVWEDEHEHIFSSTEKSQLGLGNDEVVEPYLSFEMVQPGVDMCAVCEYPSVTEKEISINGEPKKLLPVCQTHADAADEDSDNFLLEPVPLVANPLSFDVGEQVLVLPLDNGEPPEHEFMGVVVGVKNNRYVMVKDQDNNVFDCEPEQVHHVRG